MSLKAPRSFLGDARSTAICVASRFPDSQRDALEAGQSRPTSDAFERGRKACSTTLLVRNAASKREWVEGQRVSGAGVGQGSRIGIGLGAFVPNKKLAGTPHTCAFTTIFVSFSSLFCFYHRFLFLSTISKKELQRFDFALKNKLFLFDRHWFFLRG